MKSLCIPHVTQSHNSSPAMSQTVSQSRSPCSSTYHFFVNPHLKQQAFDLVLSCYFSSTCQYPYTNTTLSHYNHPHITQSLNSTPSLTKTCVCVCLQNINKDTGQQFGVLYTECSRFLFVLYICTSFRGQGSNCFMIR